MSLGQAFYCERCGSRQPGSILHNLPWLLLTIREVTKRKDQHSLLVNTYPGKGPSRNRLNNTIEETLKSITDPNLLETPLFIPEYSLTCRLLIKSESIETCSTKSILLDYIVIHTSVGRNTIWLPTYT